MAGTDYDALRAVTFTTTNPADVDSVTLTEYGNTVQVVNHDAAGAPIYLTIGRDVDTTDTPSAAGDDCFVVLPGLAANFPYPVTSPGNSVCVKTICASGQLCTVQVLTFRLV